MTTYPIARPRRLLPALALALAAPGIAAPLAAQSRTADDAAVADIRAFIERALVEAPTVPGVGVAVVVDGAPVLIDGFGVADVRTRAPVDAGTVFYIASSTKSFTGMAASILAERGELDLDAPLSRLIPGLALTPPLAADSVTLERALTHDLGFANSGVVYRTAFTGLIERADLMRVMAEATVSRPRGFRYDNLGYVLAGWALEAATGAPWQRVVEREVLRPLGMTRTSAYVSEAAAWPLAAPHVVGANGFEAIPFAKSDASMAPAGGMVTTAADAARWLVANLEAGRVDGRQAIPAAAVAAAHRPRIAVEDSFYTFSRTAYGLGWYDGYYEGDRAVHHFGGFPGWAAHVSFMPEHGIGVVVLGNAGDATYLSMIAAYAYDRLLGRGDLAAKYEPELERFAAASEARRGRAAAAAAAAPPPPPLARSAEAYAGTYVNERLGPFVIRAQDGELIVAFGTLGGTLVPVAPDSFTIELLPGMTATPVFSFENADDNRATGFDWGGRPFPRSE